MDLIEIVILACSLLNANTCSEKHMLVEMGGASPYECSMKAPPYLAQWTGEHPNFRIARWRCLLPGNEDREG